MDCIVAPSFPAFAAAFPASTGMLTLTRNRIDLLPVNGALLLLDVAGYRCPALVESNVLTAVQNRLTTCLRSTSQFAPRLGLAAGSRARRRSGGGGWSDKRRGISRPEAGGGAGPVGG